MKNKEYIKYCPMCGGVASIDQDSFGFCYVQCDRCGITTLHYEDPLKALMKWNRRVEVDLDKMIQEYKPHKKEDMMTNRKMKDIDLK